MQARHAMFKVPFEDTRYMYDTEFYNGYECGYSCRVTPHPNQRALLRLAVAYRALSLAKQINFILQLDLRYS